MQRKNSGTLFSNSQTESIKLQISIEGERVGYDIFARYPINAAKYTTNTDSISLNNYFESISSSLSAEDINDLFERLEFRINEDLLKRLKDPNYFTFIEVNFTHDPSLNSKTKITPGGQEISEILALAKENVLAVASSRPRFCNIF